MPGETKTGSDTNGPLTSDRVRFVLNGEVQELEPVDPTATVLDLLRYQLRRTGTKEGCAEGDCGACTVLLGELDGAGAMAWRSVNACILFAPMIDGRALLTVEGLAKGGELSAAQRSMVDLHGSQCGFCTPGFVMTLHGARIGGRGTSNVTPAELLAGNLCRCTGYGPILDSVSQAAEPNGSDAATAGQLSALRRTEPLALQWRDAAGVLKRGFSPRSKDELADLLLQFPDARLVAGATDVGLWVTKQHRTLDTVIFLGDCADLRGLEETDAGLTLGAGLSYSEALDALTRLHPELGAMVCRIGAVQVRNAGTIGGNIANGSPIGDMPPALIALGAAIVLRRGGERRTLALEDYFLGYGKQDRKPGEFVEDVIIPRPQASTLVRIAKLSKRFDSDISAVCAAFALNVEQGRVLEARIAFGGMAATPARARACEAAFTGQPWSDETCTAAAEALSGDFDPLTDVRGTSGYRREAAANLVRRLWREHEGLDGPRLTELAPIDA